MPKKKKVSDEVQHILEELENLKPSSEEYRITAQNLKTVMESEKVGRIDWIAIADIAARIGITILILNFEKFGVITTKLPSFLRRL